MAGKLRIIVTALIGLLAALALPTLASAQSTPSVTYWGTPTYAGSVPHATAYTGGGTITQVATANGAWYALKVGGGVEAWGDNQDGELGIGTESGFTQTPVKVAFPHGVKIAYLSNTGPQGSMLAVDTTGTAWGWGYNRYGELCTNNTLHQLVPVAISLPAPVTAIAGAGDHALFEASGVTYTCGANEDGDLGIGNDTPSTVPVVVPLPGPASALYASWRNSGAIIDGDLYSWGFGAQGGIGNGGTTDADSPVLIDLGAPVAQAAFGGSIPTNGNVLALTTTGQVFAWGSDAHGQLGDGSTVTQTSPEVISTPAPYVLVEAGGTTGYGVTADGDLYAWGDNSQGQFGHGGHHINGPMLVGSDVTQISATAALAESLSS